MEFDRTGRGFSIYRFTDRYGELCSLQMSSLAEEEAIWLGVNDANLLIMASQAAEHGVHTTETTGWVKYPVPDAVVMSTRMHLTQDQVAELMPLLQHFVETGELPEPADQAKAGAR